MATPKPASERKEGPTTKGVFQHESLQDTRSISQYLSAIAEGFEKGYLLLRNGDKEIALSPGRLLNLEVKAKRGDKKNKLTLRLSWQDGEAADEDAPLEISPLD